MNYRFLTYKRGIITLSSVSTDENFEDYYNMVSRIGHVISFFFSCFLVSFYKK